MQILLDIILSVFGIVAIGYGAARSGVFPESATKGLSTFVFNFAIPPLLFRTLAQRGFSDNVEWGFLGAYYGGAYIAWGAGIAVSLWVFRRSFAEAAVAGMSGAFGNTVLLGIPLVLTAFGDAGALPIYLIISFHSWQLFIVITLLIEGSRGNRYQLLEIPRSIAKSLITNPMLVGIAAGILWHASGVPLPKLVDVLAETLSRAALPCAVFAMGAALATFRVKGALPEASVGVVLKLIVHPAAVWLLATHVFRVDPLWRDVAVVVAALPGGVNTYLFAQRYDAGTAPAATAMLLSTMLSVVTVAVLLHILGVR